MKRILGIAIIVFCLLVQNGLAADSGGWQYKWGGAERIRHEYWRDIFDMNAQSLDNRNFFRFKTSVWGQADYEKDLSLYAKLTNEFKAYNYFGGATGSVPDKSADKRGYHFDINEVVFDNLYMDLKNFLGAPVDLRLGRQDFLGQYGEGFLIMDGTPQDGSRTFYFNAAKASWRMDDQNTLDLIYINDPRDEEFLPVINRVKLVKISSPTNDKVPQLLNTSDEQAYVLYLKNKSIENLGLEGYYIYKREAAEGGAGLQGQRSRLSTIGAFEKYDFAPWTLRSQLAYQFGKYGSEDRTGVGGYAFLDRDFKEKTWSPKATVGYVYLSGDKTGTAKNEAWDPLFSRWPNWSELYCLSYASETSVNSYWTNLQMYRASVALKPTEKIKLSFWYNYLRANQLVATPATVFSGASKKRGHLPQARVDYAFNKDVSAYFLAEYFIPGKFYVQGRDPAIFLRTEVQIKF